MQGRSIIGPVDDFAYGVWEGDALLLAEIGRSLFAQDLRVRVRLPSALAASALGAWERDDPSDGLLGDETPEQRSVRRQAGNLALIGLAVEQRSGESDEGWTVVEVDAWQIGAALDAAEERDLLAGIAPPHAGS